MSIIYAILLGAVQGLTEFLPVSSSGHLVLLESVIADFSTPGVLFEAVLHAGTLCAVLYYFRNSILNLERKYLGMIIVASVPIVFVGLVFSGAIEAMFENLFLTGVFLFITGIINFYTDKNKEKMTEFNSKNSLIIGLAQAFAIIPGVSRSGSTIFAATKLGFSPKKAAEFSFLLSVPAIVGANIFQFIKYGNGYNNINVALMLVGFLSAFISGYFAIGYAIKVLEKRRFRIFGYWAFLVGILSILLSL